MKCKLASGTLLMLLLIGALTEAFNISPLGITSTQLAPENEGTVVSSTVNVPVFQKGVSYVSWPPNFDSAYSNESLRLLSLTGTGWVSICVFYYQDNLSSTRIYPGYNTPSNSSVAKVINRVHELGMKVMLKPTVQSLNGTWDRQVPPYTEWFQSYATFIDSWANFSQKYGVDLLCIGAEFDANDVETASWENIATGVRERYSGPIVYAANWYRYQNVHWWGAVDYVGIDAYFPLTNLTDPTVEQLKAGWSPWVNAMESWQATVNKPIVFTEIGYRSIRGANKAPWNWSVVGSVDIQEQLDCYSAAFQTFYNKSWFYGLYWWNWETSPYAGGTRDAGYTPQNKPAQSLITSWYSSRAKLGDLGSRVYNNTSHSYVNEFGMLDNLVNGADLNLFLQCYKGLAPSAFMYLGDLGSRVNGQNKFFIYDGVVSSTDLNLFLQCYNGKGP